MIRRSLLVGAAATVLMPAMAVAGSRIFRTAVTEINASGATGIAGGDFDGDMLPDVMTCNAGAANELNVLRGFGDGTLTRRVQIPLNRLPSALLVARFDADQIADAIVALQNDNALVFLRGRGDGQYFDPPGPLVDSGDIGPVGLAAADFNDDGKRDLIVANEVGDSSAGSVSFLRGDGDGGFALVLQADPSDPTGDPLDALPAELGTSQVAVGELDANPGLDVLALNTHSSSISIYTTTGEGRFRPLRDPLATGPSPKDLKLVDLNRDGKLDLVVALTNADAVSVQLGNGDATFGQPVTHAVGTAPTALAVGDVDGNDTLDILAGNSRSGDVSLLRGDGIGGFGPVRTYVADAEPRALVLGDFNEDDHLDAVAATQGGSGGASVAVLRNRGDGTLHGVEDIGAGNGPVALAVADVDDDAQPDLIVAGDSGQVVVLRARGDSLAAPVHLDIGGHALGVLAVDLNGDTRPDLAVVDNQNSRVAVARSIGPGRFASLQFYPVGPNPSSITSGDFNNDGRVDLAVTSLGPPGLASVLLQLPNGRFDTANDTPVEEAPTGIAAIDADCDAFDDLVIANSASRTVMILRSLGNGDFESAQTLPDTQVGQAPTALAVADFDRDGIDDFAVSNTAVPPGTPGVRVFKGACTARFAAFRPPGAVGGVISSIVARDFTADGLVDLGLVNQTDNVVRVLRGAGNGQFQGSSPDRVSRMPVAIAAADFNSDGRYDACTANSDASANNVSVLLNCVGDADCNPLVFLSRGDAVLRGDGNNDGIRSAADLVAVAAEVMDGDGRQVEAVVKGTFAKGRVSAGVDANGDGVVTAQDRRAVARRIFAGA